jgi:dTDP-glucose 4,6-dehydratase
MNEEIFNKYKGKRVLVTGADGFMGSHLTERLIELGASVSIFVRSTSISDSGRRHLKNLHHVLDSLDQVIAGDIASSDSIELIKENKPDIILHLAAEAYVPKSFTQPMNVYDVNLTGTLNVLEAARSLNSVERIVITSSSEVYGSYSDPIGEDKLLNPTSPYGASKVAADRAGYAWHVTYNLPIAIIRPFNTYGPRHTYDVVPKFIQLALDGEPLTIYGSGEQSRDFTYVADTVKGFLLMGIHPKAVGETVNFGASAGVSVNALAEKIIQITGSRSTIQHTDERPAEVEQLTSDCTKAQNLFGWKPTISLDQGLERNISWLKEN